jgi:serine phosphatase RsbU (regulator of sigma subunit)
MGTQAEGFLKNWSVTLQPGTLLVLYTDGLIEIDRNPIEGERRLHAAAALEVIRPSTDRARGVCDRLLAGKAPSDDVAVPN